MISPLCQMRDYDGSVTIGFSGESDQGDEFFWYTLY